jgi:serine/threonine protein kinase
MTSEVISEPAGVRFGPYILTSVLGRGGMGVVYRAFDTVKGRTVALKVLIPDLAADRAFQDRFRRESKRAARLSEPHIIPIHDYGQIDGQLFIDMRLVEGVDLAAMLHRDGLLPPPAAAWIIAQIASALDAAHADGLIHRDVKPSNILISGHSQSLPFAYLIDFGIARGVSTASLSTSSGAIGTVAYMAPERFQGSPGEAAADVYSLACVLYECLTGRAPFTGELVAVMWAHINASAPAPSTLRPGLPAAVDAVIARGLAKDPAGRFGTATELAEAILAASGTAAPVTPGIPAAPVTSAPPPGRSGPPTVRDSFTGPGSATSPPAAEVPLWDSDPRGETPAALRAILSDPALGAAALSSAQAMTRALASLLPGRPREAKVLVAAAEAGVADALRYRTAQGMAPGLVREEAAGSLARQTGFRPDACRWAVEGLAAALGLDPGPWTGR